MKGIKRLAALGLIGLIGLICGRLVLADTGTGDPNPLPMSKCPANNFTYCAALGDNGDPCTDQSGECSDQQGVLHPFGAIKQETEAMVNNCLFTGGSQDVCPRKNFTSTKTYLEGDCGGAAIGGCTQSETKAFCQ